MRNQKGSSTILLVMLTLFLSLMCLYSIRVAKMNLISNRSRARAYLCMKTQLNLAAVYMQRMKRFNLAITTTHKLQVIPKIKAIHQGLIYAQQLFHLSYVKNLTNSGPCHFTQRLTFFKNMPYQTHGRLLLMRKIDGQAKIVSKKKWQYSITNYTTNDGAKAAFFLKVDVANINDQLQIKQSQEEAIGGRFHSLLSFSLPLRPSWLR